MQSGEREFPLTDKVAALFALEEARHQRRQEIQWVLLGLRDSVISLLTRLPSQTRENELKEGVLPVYYQFTEGLWWQTEKGRRGLILAVEQQEERSWREGPLMVFVQITAGSVTGTLVLEKLREGSDDVINCYRVRGMPWELAKNASQGEEVSLQEILFYEKALDSLSRRV